MGEELFRINRTLDHKLKDSTVPLDFLFDRPLGLQIFPQLSAGTNEVRPVDMRLFTHPSANEKNWTDEREGLGAAPSLVLLYDNVTARVDGANTDVDKLLREEFRRIQDRNPEMKMSLHVGSASDLYGLEFRTRYRDFHAAWVEGSVKNFQVKRTMLVLLAEAYSRINSDPQFAVKLSEPAPTKH